METAPKPDKLEVEDQPFIAFARRIINAAGRRVGAGNVDALPLLIDLHRHLDTVICTAARQLNADDDGYSWEEIADRVGVTRQTAFERWSPNTNRPRKGFAEAQRKHLQGLDR